MKPLQPALLRSTPGRQLLPVSTDPVDTAQRGNTGTLEAAAPVTWERRQPGPSGAELSRSQYA